MASPIAEKVVQPAVQARHFAYCPTMDLIALATVNERVQVFRLNGQEIFGVTERQRDAKVSKIAWKPDGQFLAVAWSNKVLYLISSRTGKVVHRIDCSRYSASTISCIGWGLNLAERERSLDLEDLISRRCAQKPVDVPADLPRALECLDVENLLPKLSPLSSGGIEDDLFSSRASLDTIFKPTAGDEYDLADVLVLGFEDGTFHLSIYDFFEIGVFSLDGLSTPKSSSRIISHCVHPDSTTHALLISSTQDSKESMKLLNLDMRLLSHAARYISTLASKSTQMRNLLRYVRQVQSQIYGDFRAALDLPRRFIGAIEETLQEKRQWTWVQAACHVLVTGNCPDDVKEWLVDQLGERGHKRWDKAMVTGYESVRRLTHENLLPALERFMVLGSRLRGLSRFHVSNEHLGLSTRDMDKIIDTVGCLQFVAHQMLIICNSELQQFRAFSYWLRQEIDLQASESTGQDDQEPHAKVDHSNAFLYIQGAMMQSQLSRFIDLDDATEAVNVNGFAKEKQSLLELYTSASESKDQCHQSATRLPRLRALISHLDGQCTQLLDEIAETQRRGVRMSQPISLVEDESNLAGMRMISSGTSEFIQYVALGHLQRSPQMISIYRTTMTLASGMSEVGDYTVARLAFSVGKIRDLRFVDDEELLVSCSEQNSSRLIRLSYRDLAYEAKDSQQPEPLSYAVDFSDEERLQDATWINFPKGVSWTPHRIEVNGEKERRVACILAEDGFHYRIYDLGQRGRDEDSTVTVGVTGR